jgi:acyl-coenzyme A synthetase/AMP-(fatty) acid ligase
MTINAAAVLLDAPDPRRIALVSAGERVTHGALRDAVARAASEWQRRGMAVGDRVAVKLPDGIAWVTAFLGAIWAGGVAVGVNPRLAATEWAAILGEADFRWILGESRDGTLATYHDRFVTLDDWRRAVRLATPIEPVPMDEESPAFWGHSSGTTGRPKAVVHAQRFALHCQRVAAEVFGITKDDRLYATSKLFFAYPQANSLFPGLKLGATVILESDWPNPAKVAAVITRERPTVFLTVPSMYRALLKEGHAAQLRGRGIRLCISAGEALPANLRDDWQRATDVRIADGYGTSETLCLVLVNPDSGEGFVPAPGVEVAPLASAENAGPTRLAIRAPTLSLGYYNRSDAQAEYYRAGGFCAADLFTRTAEGRFRFGGREDSLVKVRGRWVDLVALEEYLGAASTDIVEAAAVSVADADGVASVAFYYVAKPDTERAVAAAVAARVDPLPPHQQPCSVTAIAALPRTATGKLMRRQLAELYTA